MRRLTSLWDSGIASHKEKRLSSLSLEAILKNNATRSAAHPLTLSRRIILRLLRLNG